MIFPETILRCGNIQHERGVWLTYRTIQFADQGSEGNVLK